MKAKIITAFLTFLTFNAFGQDCHETQSITDKSVKDDSKSLEAKRRILCLYQAGVLQFDDDGNLTLSDDGDAIIEELKEQGLFQQVKVLGEGAICI